jgi:hypothetical protein
MNPTVQQPVPQKPIENPMSLPTVVPVPSLTSLPTNRLSPDFSRTSSPPITQFLQTFGGLNAPGLSMSSRTNSNATIGSDTEDLRELGRVTRLTPQDLQRSMSYGSPLGQSQNWMKRTGSGHILARSLPRSSTGTTLIGGTIESTQSAGLTTTPGKPKLAVVAENKAAEKAESRESMSVLQSILYEL